MDFDKGAFSDVAASWGCMEDGDFSKLNLVIGRFI